MNNYIDVLKKYAVFTGRASRKEYWMFFLFNILISIIFSLVSSGYQVKTGTTSLNILSTIYTLAVFIPSLAVGVRRLHDINRSGWLMLIFAFLGLGSLSSNFVIAHFANSAAYLIVSIIFSGISLIAAIVLLVFLVRDSTPGDNKYGPNPKGVGAVAPVAPAV